MSGFFQKRAGEVIDCRIDWRQGYLEPGEKLAADMGWQVAAKQGHRAAQVVSRRHDGAVSTATVAAGDAGAVYMLCAKAVTDRGRELNRAVTLRVV